MEDNKKFSTGFAVVLAIGFIIGAVIISNTWKKVTSNNVTINVTGSASKEIKSDLGIWQGSFTAEAPTMQEAYKKLQEVNTIVKNYLISFGFPEDKIIFSAINTNPVTGYASNKKLDYRNFRLQDFQEKVVSYTLGQSVQIEFSDVDKIESLSRRFTELINQGISIYSEPPQFLYTKLSDLKIEMIGLASQDAKTRAEQMAKATGNKLGDIRSSRTGVMQINEKNSYDVSDYGNNDTKSLIKNITAVVNMNFLIE